MSLVVSQSEGTGWCQTCPIWKHRLMVMFGAPHVQSKVMGGASHVQRGITDW